MLRIVTGALITAALLTAVPAATQTMTANPLLFTVNGEEVYAADVSVVMKSLQGQFAQRGQTPPNEELMRMATQRIVEQKLLAQEARRLEIKHDDKRVNEALENIESQLGGRAALDANLAKGGTNYKRFVDNMREGDLAQTYVDTKIIPGVEVSEEEMQQYYDANPDTFQVPDQVRARHILIKVEEGADEATVEEAKARAEQARARAVDGEDFTRLAMEVSEGPSAGNGGDLGAFTADRMVEPFSKAAFALDVGEISEVVRTKFGFHVIKVEERKPAGVTPFEEAKPGLEQALRMSKIQGAIRDTIDRLREAATIENSFTPPGTPEGADAPQDPASSDAGTPE